MNGAGKIAALVLAAGRSSRMGRLKPLLPLGESTVVEQAVLRLRRGGVEDVRVVLGFGAERISPVLDALGAPWIVNPDYDAGMLSSALAGIRSFGPEVEAFFLLPVDIPLIKPSTVRALAERRRATGASVVYPCFLGERGHPPLISTAIVKDVDDCREGGLRAHLGRYEASALDCDVIDQAVVMDCDAPHEYEMLRAYLARRDAPTVRECEAIWEMLRVPDGVRAHSRRVAELAFLLAVRLHPEGGVLNEPLIVAGGLLHDVMKGRPDHARAGAEALRAMEFPEVARIVRPHMEGAAPGDEIMEVDLVFLVDKMVDGVRVVRIEERFERAMKRFADEPEALAAVTRRFGHARAVGKRVEERLGMSLERFVERHSGGLRAGAPVDGRRLIFLARHGAAETGDKRRYIGQLDVPLCPEGVRQAEALREEMRGVSFAGGIFCSDLERSAATAKIVAEPHGIAVSVRIDLREIALGEWEGRTFEEVRSLHPEDFEARGRDFAHFRPPGGESFLDCMRRVIPALFEMIYATNGAKLLVVAHAGVNRMILCRVLNRDIEKMFEIPQDYCRFNVLEYKDFSFQLPTGDSIDLSEESKMSSAF